MCMKHFLSILIFSLVSALAFSQSTLATGGGNFNGDGGSFSYSVGQTFYNVLGKNITVTEGVQQPYEISEYKPDDDGKKNEEDDNETIAVELSVYPNPTDDFLTLTVAFDKYLDVEFQLFDVNGKCLDSSMIVSTKTLLDMHSLASGTYFVRINEVGKEIKTFKVVKK